MKQRQISACQCPLSLPQPNNCQSHSEGLAWSYLIYHYGTSIQQQIEIEAESHIRALDWAPKVQLKSRRNENMNKEVRPWGVHPLKQFTWVNGSSPTPVRLGRRCSQCFKIWALSIICLQYCLTVRCIDISHLSHAPKVSQFEFSWTPKETPCKFD